MTFLDASHNKISEIFEKSFQKATGLQTLYLNDNQIEKINLRAFESLLQLRILDISNNKLKTFTLEMFGSNKFTGNKMRKLNLCGNKLMMLDSALLAILRNLISLNLSFVSKNLVMKFLKKIMMKFYKNLMIKF